METQKGEHREASLVEFQPAVPAKKTFAQDLFDSIAPSYDTWAQVLTFFQYLRWRRFLVSQMNLRPGDFVLDVCTGTAGVAMEIADHHDGRIVGLDASELMLQAGLRAIEKKNLDGRVQLIQGRAERLPFPDETFDTVVFTYLLRYVQDPDATIRELSRVLKPGGELLSLEFSVPPPLWIRTLWLVYTRGILPVSTIPAPGGWHEAGTFLGPSISRFCKSYPVSKLEKMWYDHGFATVKTRYLLGGVAIAMWGKKS